VGASELSYASSDPSGGTPDELSTRPQADAPPETSRQSGMGQDWHREPMSDKQEKFLRSLCDRAGRSFDPTLSKQEARWVIRELAEFRYPHRGEVRKVACPKCGARPDRYCVSAGGGKRASNHLERVVAARKEPVRGGSTEPPSDHRTTDKTDYR
jgi:hypothetical protein